MRDANRHSSGIVPKGARPRLDGDIIVATVLINVLTLCLPIAMMQTFPRVLPDNSTGTLAGAFMILLGYITLEPLLKILRVRLFLAEAAVAEKHLARAVFDGLFKAPLSGLAEIGRDEVTKRVNRLRDTGKLRSSIVMASRIDLMFIVVFITVIYAVSPVLAGVALAAIGTAALWSIRTRSRFLSASKAPDLNDTRRTSCLIEIFRMIPTVTLLGIDHLLLRRYEILRQNASSARDTSARITASAVAIAAMVGQVATGLVAVVGAYLVIETQIGLAELAAIVLLTGRSVQPVVQALFVDMEIEVLRRKDAECREIADLPRRRGDTVAEPMAEPAWQTGATSIQLLGVTLRETWTNAMLLNRAYLNIAPGTLTVVNGRSDAPAEALLRLFSGQESPSEGVIKLRDKDHGRAGPFVYLGHDPDLHDGTILQNLTAFRGRTFEPEALRIARQLGVDVDIQVIPSGYSHILTLDGCGHGSHGFCRKLRLARSLAMPAGLFLLDRPFLGLDRASQAKLLICLQELRRHSTVVVTNPPPELDLQPDLTIQLRPDLTPKLVWSDDKDPELSAFLMPRRMQSPRQVPA